MEENYNRATVLSNPEGDNSLSLSRQTGSTLAK